MIDIIKASIVRGTFRFAESPPGLWVEQSFRRAGVVHGEIEVARRVLVDRVSGLRVFGDGESALSAEVSLPRLLFGSNGRLLTAARELEEALGVLRGKVGEVVSGAELAEFTRVDLCWQFAGDAEQFIQAHRTFRFPGIRSGPGVWDGTITWGRGRGDLRVSLYDKGRELRCGRGKVVRLEIGLRGDRLRRAFNGDLRPVVQLDFDRCYEVFRRLALRLQPSEVAKPKGMAAFLAVGERDGWAHGGVSAFEFWAGGKTERSVRAMRKAMAAARVETFRIDWRTLLPVDGPPAAVEVTRLARQSDHRAE